MASSWPPKKNTAFTLYFTLYKNDGTVIANPGTITKKVSVDGAAVADIAADVTEEDTTYGQCSVVLAAGEMNGDGIWVYIKDDTSGCVPFTATIYTAGQTLDEIEALVDDIGAAGAGLTAVPWNAAWDAEVQSECADALTAYGFADDTDVATAVRDVTLTGAAAGSVGAGIASVLEDTGELQTDWANGGRLDLILDAAGAAGDPWITELPGAYGAGTAGKIVGDNINAPIATVDTVVDGLAVSVAALTESQIKKNTALENFTFYMTDSTNHAADTGLTVTAERSLDGGAFAACANAVTELSDGCYTIDLAATDMNADVVVLKFTATGADDLVMTLVTAA